MRSLLLLAFTLFSICDGVTLIQIHNKCHFNIPIVRVNAYGEKTFVFTAVNTTSFCEFRSGDDISYQIGMNGKLRTDLRFPFPNTRYMLNATAGFDYPVSVFPKINGDRSAEPIKCLDKNCKDALHANDKNKELKWHTTKGDVIDITYCPQNDVYVDETCMGPDYD